MSHIFLLCSKVSLFSIWSPLLVRHPPLSNHRENRSRKTSESKDFGIGRGLCHLSVKSQTLLGKAPKLKIDRKASSDPQLCNSRIPLPNNWSLKIIKCFSIKNLRFLRFREESYNVCYSISLHIQITIFKLSSYIRWDNRFV